MPINPVHFAADPNASTGVTDIVEALSKGFNAGFSPFEKVEGLKGKQEDRRKTLLSNILAEKLMPYAVQKELANIANTQAQTGHYGMLNKKLRMDTDPEAYVDYVNKLTAALTNGNDITANSPTMTDAQIDEFMASKRNRQPEIGGMSQVGEDTRNLFSPQQEKIVNAYQDIVAGKNTSPTLPGVGNLREMLLRKQLGLPMVTPEEAANLEIRKRAEEEQNKLDIKKRVDLEQELPVVKQKLKDVDKLIKLVEKNPQYFGAGWFGTDFRGPDFRKRWSKDPEYGQIEGGLAKLVAPMAQELSSKGLASALNYALNVKPGFGENPEIALGKLRDIKRNYEEAIERETSLYKQRGGKEDNQNIIEYNSKGERI